MKDKSAQVIAFLKKAEWIQVDDPECVFLAAGEYNENYLVTAGDDRYVFRINHDTQLELENQVEYEYWVLEAVSGSGVTPRPYRYDLNADGLGKGALLMEFLPGRPLDYKSDLAAAARIFAKIHSLPPDKRLIVQGDPAKDIATESYGLLQRYSGVHFPEVRKRLFEYHAEIVKSSEEMSLLYRDEELCIVNTEVNSGNFLIDAERASLVDWEKAVVSYRYQDLAHFLIPTTTLWKTDYRFSEEDRHQFLSHYFDAGGWRMSMDEISAKTKLMERVILLRALSWCYMAYHEYTAADRELAHDHTFATISKYLNEAECFLA